MFRIQDLRNPNAFFMSCARKYLDKRNDYGHRQQQNVQQRGSSNASFVSPRQHGPASSQHDRTGHGTGGGIESLPDSLQQIARQAISRHHPILTETTFDEGVVGYIKRLPQEDALSVFEELLGADLSSVS